MVFIDLKKAMVIITVTCLTVIVVVSINGLNQLKRHNIDAYSRVRPTSTVDCKLLIQNDNNTQHKALLYQESNPKVPISNQEYINKTRNCDQFIVDRDYIMSTTTEDEEDFPLAFSMLIFKDIESFERLLRAIYRPHNIYCIHVDKKSQPSFHEAVRGIADCFDNVFVLHISVDVRWGTFTVLEPEIICMEALLKYKKWKYFINLTGQEFPLKTNWELVQILKALNGSNIVDATIKRRNLNRFEGRPPPPIPVTPVKSGVHVIVRREFVEFAIMDVKSQKLLNWTKLVDIPDETFFGTLNHNPQLGIPGSYLGEHETHPITNPYIARYKIWIDKKPCHGKFVHAVCIFGVRDLPWLAGTSHLFANKFHIDYQPLTLDCVEELIYNRTQEELNGLRQFNVSYYRELNVTHNHI